MDLVLRIERVAISGEAEGFGVLLRATDFDRLRLPQIRSGVEKRGIHPEFGAIGTCQLLKIVG